MADAAAGLRAFLEGLVGTDLGLWLVGALDVAIVAFILYRVLLLIRGTRAAYTLVGLLAVGALFLVAQQLGLTTVRWLLDSVINYLLLIVIIVFQADIRRGLMRMGWRVFTPSRVGLDTGTVEEVNKACETMMHARIGALIVFEQEVDLTELMQAGTPIDGRVSRDLLQSLFCADPGNPLHDGAIVIRRDRVRRAGTLLPLSANPALDRSLGTRHRAAVGITEDTDAVALVVSEERGTAAVCRQGRIRHGLGPSALRKELLAVFAKSRPRRRIMTRAVARLGEMLFVGDRAADGERISDLRSVPTSRYTAAPKQRRSSVSASATQQRGDDAG